MLRMLGPNVVTLPLKSLKRATQYAPYGCPISLMHKSFSMGPKNPVSDNLPANPHQHWVYVSDEVGRHGNFDAIFYFHTT